MHTPVVLFSKDESRNAMINNLRWIIFFIPATAGLGLLFSVLFNKLRYEAIAKIIIFMPIGISFTAVAIIWKFMYAYQPPGVPQYGTVNAILTALFDNYQPRAWLVEKSLNNGAIIISGVWMWTGFSMVLFSAAVKSVPQALIDACRIDGSNGYQTFIHVTLPHISTTIMTVITLLFVEVLRIFDLIYIMTNGNLGTNVIANLMFREMFKYRNFGAASAIAVILSVLMVPIIILNIRHYHSESKKGP